jgi:hypothetical protein
MPEQLRHHEVAQALFANPPLEGVDRQACARWRWNKMESHIDDIHLLKIAARA